MERDYKELVALLRAFGPGSTIGAAADAIEALIADRDNLRKEIDKLAEHFRTNYYAGAGSVVDNAICWLTNQRATIRDLQARMPTKVLAERDELKKQLECVTAERDSAQVTGAKLLHEIERLYAGIDYEVPWRSPTLVVDKAIALYKQNKELKEKYNKAVAELANAAKMNTRIAPVIFDHTEGAKVYFNPARQGGKTVTTPIKVYAVRYRADLKVWEAIPRKPNNEAFPRLVSDTLDGLMIAVSEALSN